MVTVIFEGRDSDGDFYRIVAEERDGPTAAQQARAAWDELYEHTRGNA